MSFVYLDFLGIIQDIFKKIFDAVLAPVLKKVFTAIFTIIIRFIKEALSEFFLELLGSLLRIVDYIAQAFDILAGTSEVSYKGQDTTILEAFFSMPSINKAFYLLTAVAAVLALALTTLAVMKSMSDMVLDNKHPVSAALSQGFKAFLAILLIPLLCTCILKFGTIILVQTSISLSGKEETEVEYPHDFSDSKDFEVKGTTPGDLIFVSIAGQNIKYPEDVQPDQKAEYRRLVLKWYMTHSGGKAAEVRKYYQMEQVKKDFEITEINYFIGFIAGGAMLIVMLSASLYFVQRILELLMLYMVSPFFAATMPMDDGASFKKWKDMFIAKFFAGFGVIVSLKIYLMVLPLVAAGRIKFMDDFYMDNIIQMTLVLGGAWAVFKGQNMILMILCPEAGYAAGDGFAAMYGYLSAGKAKVTGAASSAGSAIAKKASKSSKDRYDSPPGVKK